MSSAPPARRGSSFQSPIRFININQKLSDSTDRTDRIAQTTSLWHNTPALHHQLRFVQDPDSVIALHSQINTANYQRAHDICYELQVSCYPSHQQDPMFDITSLLSHDTAITGRNNAPIIEHASFLIASRSVSSFWLAVKRVARPKQRSKQLSETFIWLASLSFPCETIKRLTHVTALY